LESRTSRFEAQITEIDDSQLNGGKQSQGSFLLCAKTGQRENILTIERRWDQADR